MLICNRVNKRRLPWLNIPSTHQVEKMKADFTLTAGMTAAWCDFMFNIKTKKFWITRPSHHRCCCQLTTAELKLNLLLITTECFQLNTMSKTSYFNFRQMTESYIDKLSHYFCPFCRVQTLHNMPQLLLAHFMLLYSIVGDTFYAMLTATAEKEREVNNKPIMANLIKILAC